ncbi:MAG: DUF6263 family protein [Bacteroidales bacterium]|nr:DUF6263 family protein [Bacteroidales bacterium]
MKKHITIILSAIVALTMVSFMANDSVLLRLKPQVGKTMTINMKSSQIMTMNVQGQSIANSQTIESKTEMTATNVTADSIFCTAKMKSMKMTQSAMGMTMTYDTEHPEDANPMLAGAMKPFQDAIDKELQVVFDPLSKTMKMPSENIPNISATYPVEAVSVGSQWTADNTQNIAGTDIVMTATYTVTKITKKETTVNVESVIKSDIASGTNSGSMVIDNATGLTKTSTIKTNMSLTISEQGLSIPTTVTATTTLNIE